MRTTLGHVRSLVREAKSSAKDANKLNVYSSRDVRSWAVKRSFEAVKELLETGWYKEQFSRISAVAKRQYATPRVDIRFTKNGTGGPSQYRGGSGFILISFGDVFSPNISFSSKTLRDLIIHATNAGWNDWREDFQKIRSDLRDVIGPRPAEGPLWWADESMYPIRPLLEGESPHLRPDPSWIVIDINTHEEWMEGKGYDDDTVPY